MSNNFLTGTQRPFPVFDGHNDVLLRLYSSHREDAVSAFLQGPTASQIDLPRIRQGGLAGGLFAVYVPSPKDPAKSVPENDSLFVNHATPSMVSARELRLVKACNAKRIMVDLSHMDEKGFWQTAGISDAPLVASHSNAHVLCAQSRNLTDKQLDAIRESNGFVGVNFGTAFRRADGKKDPNATVEEIVRHVDYLLNRLGEDGVGLGSDFDGTTVPPDLHDVAGLPILVDALTRRGYDRPLLEKICYGNWLRVLEATGGK